MSPEDFDRWGWRIPFWVSILMVYVSYLIRKNMGESPVFAKAKEEGKTSSNPLKESFGNRYNLKFVLLALFGASMGQGVVWYTGQFYVMSFMERVMHVNPSQVISILVVAFFLGTPFYIIFGGLSDKIGRKTVMMGGMLIAALTLRPIYRALYETTDITRKTEVKEKTITLAELKANESSVDSVYTTKRYYTDGSVLTEVKTVALEQGVAKWVDGKPQEKISTTIEVSAAQRWKLTFLVLAQILFVAMAYSPIAAFLVELFPVRIRYTSMSLPYHVGSGIFGGLLPAIATYFVDNAQKAGKSEFYLEGLWYPIAISATCFVVGTIYITKKMMTRHAD